ncbi:hypothetical protein CEV33_1764 [Brucella grignonensis]|uniref:Uncharacterized protein n=1 Tax=Brucella grignonensis TaxID=94627 RepID=A0A256F634_9HYPH|nr:hypothetical protein CEV33_1764 [Brucella grignonensis]
MSSILERISGRKTGFHFCWKCSKRTGRRVSFGGSLHIG